MGNAYVAYEFYYPFSYSIEAPEDAELHAQLITSTAWGWNKPGTLINEIGVEFKAALGPEERMAA